MCPQHDHNNPALTRRHFLQASLAGSVAAVAGAPLAGAALAPKADADTTSAPRALSEDGDTTRAAFAAMAPQAVLPKRKIGREGHEITILGIGGAMDTLNLETYDAAWNSGIRYFDSADCYVVHGDKKEPSEPILAEWLRRHPERRKELFIVGKDHPRESPQQLLTMIDTRLQTLGIDYFDLFFIHGIGTGEYGEKSLEWPKSNELREIAATLKKMEKVRLFGFSSHDPRRAEYLMAAAEGGFIDAIMFMYSPFMDAGDTLSQAMDACHKAGIGLIAMKTMQGHGTMPKRLPEFDKLGLTTHQALLQAVWSDPRLSAVLNHTMNAEQMAMNVEAARAYKEPLKPQAVALLRETALACGPTFCPNCDGRCARAAGVDGALGDLVRHVNYYEREGVLQTRDLYRPLHEAMANMRGADLEAAREACLCHLDFAKIVKNAERYFEC